MGLIPIGTEAFRIGMEVFRIRKGLIPIGTRVIPIGTGPIRIGKSALRAFPNNVRMERSAFCTKNTSFLCMDMTASAANAVEEGMRPEAVNTSAQAMPPYVEANYKPVVAVVFAIILLVAGV